MTESDQERNGRLERILADVEESLARAAKLMFGV